SRRGQGPHRGDARRRPRVGGGEPLPGPDERPLRRLRRPPRRATRSSSRPRVGGEEVVAQVTYIEAIRLAMLEEMEGDERVFVIGEDVGTYGGAFRATQGFLEKFGETRIIDTPISETAIVGAAIGAALMGMRPIAEMQFIDFISCAFDMLVNYAAKTRYRWGASVPIVVRGPSGGGVHGGPFHSQNPEAYFMNVPGLKIVAPATAFDAKGLLTAAIRDPDPVIFFDHTLLS